MKKFMVIYNAPVDAAEQMKNSTPEQQAKGMEAWMTWSKNCGNKLLDLGSPLMGGQQLKHGGASGKANSLGGFSILQAENIDEAKSLLKDHPHLGWHPEATIEVHEFMPLPGM